MDTHNTKDRDIIVHSEVESSAPMETFFIYIYTELLPLETN